MEKEARRIRRTEKKPSGLTSWLRREGRRCCAVVLCVSMIVGNAANLAFAAEESISGSFLFRLDRASLYDALQEAVLEGDIVDKEFEFQGEAAEEYGLLLNETEGHDGELYELRPEIAHNEGNLGLRIFARLDGEIPLGDEEETIEYEITGSEEFIFLLTNRSHKEYQAVIQVDDKRSEVITVVPGSSLQAGLEDSPYTSAADFGPGETEGAEGTVDAGITTAPGGGSGGGGGGGGGSSHTGSTPQEGAEDTANREDTEDGTQGGSQENSGTADKNNDKIQNPDQEGAEGNDHNSGSAQEGNASDSADNSSDSQNGADLSGSDHNQAGNSDSDSSHSGNNSDKSDSDKNDSADSSHDSGSAGGSTSQGGSSENSGSADSGSGSSDSDHSSDSGSSGGGAGSSSGSEGSSSSSGGSEGGSSGSEGSSSGGGSSSGSSSDSGSSSSGSGSSDSGSSSSGSGSSDSGSSSSGGGSSDGGSGSSGSGSSDSGSSSSGGGSSDSGSSSSGGGGGEQSASISRHGVSLVTMSLDEIVADEAVASPSDAEAAEKADEIETEETSQTEGTGEAAADQKAEEATPSDADEDVLDGQIYEAVLLGEDAAVAFVTTASEMLLDEEDYRTASPSNAYPAKIREFNADGVVVVVEAEDGVLPEDAELTVTELVKEEADTAEQYERAEKALEEAGAEYAGMMAFDISFWLDGEEIEPDGPVQVSMRVDSERLPKEADPESLEIHHLVGTDEVEAVEIVADTGDKAEGIVEVDEAEALAAEFEVESFSTFTITWTDYKNYNLGLCIKISAECVEPNESGGYTVIEIEDGKKTELFCETYSDENGELDFSEKKYSDNNWDYEHSKETLVITGYTFVGALYKDNLFTKIRLGGYQEDNKLITIYCYDKNGNDVYNEVYPVGENGVELNVRFVYEKDGIAITINDSIPQDGYLTANLPTETSGENIIYKWFGNTGDDFETAEEIHRELVTGNHYNLSEDGRSVNVAVDWVQAQNENKGISRYYWVQAYEINEGKEKLLGISSAYYVSYNEELKNGGFEKPGVPNSTHFDQVSVGSLGLEWNTTNDDQKVELADQFSSFHNINKNDSKIENSGVPEGEQCGEINSTGDGALYQDVLTVPGSTLYWQLYHRARGNSGQGGNTSNKDTMYVLIMSTQDAEEMFQTEDGKNVTSRIRELIKHDSFPGSVWELTDDGTKWWFHNDAYTVPEEQYMTRFFFISGDENHIANDDKNMSQANLLDDVSFSTKLKPPSEENKGHLSITKTVEGLSEKEIENYKIKLSIKNEKDELIDAKELEGVESNPIELDSFVLTSDKTYSATCVIPNLNTEGKYRISEEVVTSEELTNRAETPRVKKDGETEFSELKIGESVETSITTRGTSSIQIVNAYKDKVAQKALTIGKEVKNGNKNEKFTFEYKVLNGNDEISESEYENIKVYEGDNVDNNATGHQFTLTGGQKKRIEGIPSGYRVVVTELDASDYDTLITHKEGSPIKQPGVSASISQNNAAIVGKSFELDITEDTEVLFTNSKKVVTPTGVHTNSIPHLLLLAMAALGMAGMAATGTTAKARKKEEE